MSDTPPVDPANPPGWIQRTKIIITSVFSAGVAIYTGLQHFNLLPSSLSAPQGTVAQAAPGAGYTLVFNNGQSNDKPDASAVKDAVNLAETDDDHTVELKTDDTNFMKATYDPKEQTFSMDYEEGSAEKHWSSKESIGTTEMISAMQHYLTGDKGFKTLYGWNHEEAPAQEEAAPAAAEETPAPEEGKEAKEASVEK